MEPRHIEKIASDLSTHVTRRSAVKGLAGAGAVGITGLASSRAAAQQATPVAVDGPSLVGLWIVTVSFPGDQPLVLPNLVTYHADGTMLLTPPVRMPPMLPGTGAEVVYFSSGQGVWAPNPDGSTALRFAFLVSDENGNLAGINNAIATILLDPGGNSYTGTFALDIADAAGNVTSSSGGTLQGKRITTTSTDPIVVPGGVVTGT